ncbi:MAG: thiamine ABC transporter ATP-binding protein ThiQ [Sodalis sp. (in: enterobacteria)]
MITLDNITWFYRDLPMRFHLHLNGGEKVAVLGPSGAGKSTLLNLIAGFLTPHSGNLWLDGVLHHQTPPARRPISMLFQENNLFMHLTVAENIGIGLHPGLRLTSTQRIQLRDAARQAGLEKVLDRLPAAISGGQRQRTALVRCLVRQEPILLLDEPFSALDPALRAEMIRLLNDVCAARHLTLLMVSHNLDDALRLAPRTLLVVDRRIYYDGSTAALASRESPAASILGISR